MIQDETLPDTVDSCHIQMVHYDEKFENLGPHIFGDSSMIYPSYLSSIREACYTKDPFANIHPMVSPDYQSLLCSSRCIEEIVQHAISYVDECLMMH